MIHQETNPRRVECTGLLAFLAALLHITGLTVVVLKLSSHMASQDGFSKDRMSTRKDFKSHLIRLASTYRSLYCLDMFRNPFLVAHDTPKNVIIPPFIEILYMYILYFDQVHLISPVRQLFPHSHHYDSLPHFMCFPKNFYLVSQVHLVL